MAETKKKLGKKERVARLEMLFGHLSLIKAEQIKAMMENFTQKVEELQGKIDQTYKQINELL